MLTITPASQISGLHIQLIDTDAPAWADNGYVVPASRPMNLPAAIDHDALVDALRGLGIAVDERCLLRRVVIDETNVALTYEALDRGGKPIAIGDALAEVTYSVPLTSDDEPMRA